MRKELGYFISILGIIIIALGFKTINFGWTVLNSINSNYTSEVGGLFVLIGIIILLKSEKSNLKDNGKELPIFEGTGKKRKIIGYIKN